MSRTQFCQALNQSLLFFDRQASDTHIAALPSQDTKATQAFQKGDLRGRIYCHTAIFRQKALPVKNTIDKMLYFAQSLNHYE